MLTPPNTPDAWSILRSDGANKAYARIIEFAGEAMTMDELIASPLVRFIMEEFDHSLDDCAKRLAYFKIIHDLPA